MVVGTGLGGSLEQMFPYPQREQTLPHLGFPASRTARQNVSAVSATGDEGLCYGSPVNEIMCARGRSKPLVGTKSSVFPATLGESAVSIMPFYRSGHEGQEQGSVPRLGPYASR